MRKLKLKENVTQQMLEDNGFKRQDTPLAIYYSGMFTESQEDEVIIDWKDRCAKWRYQHNEKQIYRGLLPVINLFDFNLPDIGDSPINKLAKEIHVNAVEHGWWDEERTLGDIIALIHTELSEAFEEYRNGKPMFYEGKKGKPEGIAIELIDAVIRIFDYLAKEGIDIEKAIILKHLYNKTRSYKHGGKVI